MKDSGPNKFCIISCRTKALVIRLCFGFVYIVQIFFLESAFGKVPVTFEIDDLRCNGNEARLIDCPRSSSGHNCNLHEGAGVICYQSSYIGIYNSVLDMNTYFPQYGLYDQISSKITYCNNRYMSQIIHSSKKIGILFCVVLNRLMENSPQTVHNIIMANYH